MFWNCLGIYLFFALLTFLLFFETFVGAQKGGDQEPEGEPLG